MGRDFILKLLKYFLEKGLYTHCYASYGNLRQDAPLEKIFLRAPGCLGEIFDLASITKVLALSPVFFSKMEANGWSSQMEIGELSPAVREFLDFKKQLLDLKFVDLLSHQSGLPFWSNFWVGRLGPNNNQKFYEKSKSRHIQKVFLRQPIAGDPKQVYSDLGFILLGHLLEIESKKNLASLFQGVVDDFGLGQNTEFALGYQLARPQLDFVPSAYCRIRERNLYGEVHDENSAALGGLTGHAGLFGDGYSVEIFLRHFFQSKLMDNLRQHICGRRYFGFKRSEMSQWQGLGGCEALGHYGFTGGGFWFDPGTGNYSILLTNRVISQRLSADIVKVRNRFFQNCSQLLETI